MVNKPNVTCNSIINFYTKYRNIILFLSVFIFMIVLGIMFLSSMPNELHGSDYYNFTIIIVILCVLITGIFLYILLFKKTKIETLFLFAYISIGIIYILVITPLSPPDEYHHWQQTSRFSDYLRFEYTGEFYSGDVLNIGGSFHVNSKEAYSTVMNTLFIKSDAIGDYFPYGHRDVGGGYTYPVQYLPGFVGLALGKTLPISSIMTFYSGRLTNLLFSAVLLFFSIKILPKYKISIFVISMLPMFLHQSASYSYDAYINGMSILLISLVLREIHTKKPNSALETSRYLLITVIAVLLAPAKYVYSLFIFLVLLIPQNRFKSKKDYYIKTLLSICITLTVTVVSFYINTVLNPAASDINWEGHKNYTNSFIFSNPVQTIEIFLNTTITNFSFYVNSCFGNYLAGLTLHINPVFVTAFIILFIFTFFSNDSENIPNNKQLRLFLVFISIAIYTGVLYSMFVGWTSDIYTIIQGVQGRYFIPLLLPIAIIFNNRLFVYKEGFEKVIISAAVILNVLVIYDVMYKTIMA